MSEGNKLARLSEVKTLIDPAIKQYSVTLRASHNTFRKKNMYKKRLALTREEESMLIIG